MRGEARTTTYIDPAKDILGEPDIEKRSRVVWWVGAKGGQFHDVEGKLLDDLQVGAREHEECGSDEALSRRHARPACTGTKRNLCDNV
jgi:hypothetical protein